MIKSGIYAIYNWITDKYYIGQSINIRKRWNYHKMKLRRGNHHSSKLQNSWNKYGEKSFKFIIISNVLSDEREKHYMDLYNVIDNGYNICPLPETVNGIKRNRESTEKMINSQKHMRKEMSIKSSFSNKKFHLENKDNPEYIEMMRKREEARIKTRKINDEIRNLDEGYLIRKSVYLQERGEFISKSKYSKLTNKNTSGSVGISFNKKCGKWMANITINKNRIYLGLFNNIDDAIMARKSAELTS